MAVHSFFPCTLLSTIIIVMSSIIWSNFKNMAAIDIHIPPIQWWYDQSGPQENGRHTPSGFTTYTQHLCSQSSSPDEVMMCDVTRREWPRADANRKSCEKALYMPLHLLLCLFLCFLM